MNPRLIELSARKQGLQSTAGAQRAELARRLAQLKPAGAALDRARAVTGYLRVHPQWILVPCGVLLALRPRRVLALIGPGLAIWRVWRQVRALL